MIDIFYDAKAENMKIDAALGKIEAVIQVNGPKDEYTAIIEAIKILAEAVKTQADFWEETASKRMTLINPLGLS